MIIALMTVMMIVVIIVIMEMIMGMLLMIYNDHCDYDSGDDDGDYSSYNDEEYDNHDRFLCRLRQRKSFHQIIPNVLYAAIS